MSADFSQPGSPSVNSPQPSSPSASLPPSSRPLKIIGNNTFITVGGISHIPAKVDTGADTSSIWASQISVAPDGRLTFVLFASESPLYTGEVLTADEFSVKQVRSSNGQVAVRYQVILSTQLAGRRIRVRYTLADRSRNRFPALIGRKAIQNKFLVDVSRVKLPRSATFDNDPLNAELRSDPHKFHQKYMAE